MEHLLETKKEYRNLNRQAIASLVFKFLNKKATGANISDGAIKNKILSNQHPLDLAT